MSCGSLRFHITDGMQKNHKIYHKTILQPLNCPPPESERKSCKNLRKIELHEFLSENSENLWKSQRILESSCQKKQNKIRNKKQLKKRIEKKEVSWLPKVMAIKTHYLNECYHINQVESSFFAVQQVLTEHNMLKWNQSLGNWGKK